MVVDIFGEHISENYKYTEVGKIPSDWKVKTIGEVANIVGGGTPNTFNLTFWNGNINWFTPTEIGSSKYVVDSKRKITQDGYKNSSARLLPIGTILLTSRAGIGDTAILKAEGCTNQGFQSLIVHPDYDNEFLYYFINAIKRILIQNASGSTFLELSPSRLKSIRISLPPTKAEQAAIATALSDADALIRSLEKLIAKKRLIKQGLMQELLKPKEGWVVKKLGEVGIFKKGRGIRKDQMVRDGLPCIRYGELYTHHHEYIKEINSFINSETAKESEKINKGDILFAGSGETKEEIGKCATFLYDSEAYAGGDVIIFTPKNIDPLFLGFLLNSRVVAQQKAQIAQGDAVVHIYPNGLSNIIISIPPVKSEQKNIANSLFDMNTEIIALELKLEKYKQIKQGMMQNLLTGKIRLV